MCGLSAKPTVFGAVAGFGVDDATGVDRSIAEGGPNRIGCRSEVVDRLGQQCNRVRAVDLAAVEHRLNGGVYRPVSCFVNHTVHTSSRTHKIEGQTRRHR